VTPKHIKTTAVNKSDYIIYLKKANDFYETAQKASDSELWAAVGLNAVHCAISCCDALLAFHLGIRSVSDDHMDAADLLMRIPQAKSSGEANTYKRIIAKKNLIAYDCREFRQSEAIDISKQAERFYNWTLANLPK
jgi:hypothetical protein